MFYCVFFAILTVLITLIVLNKFVFIPNNKRQLILEKIVKIVAIVWSAVYLLQCLLPDLLCLCYSEEDLLTKNYTLQAFLRWFNDLAFVLLPCVVFFNKKHLNRVAGLFLLPVALLNVCFYGKFAQLFTDGRGLGTIPAFAESGKLQAFLTNPTFRAWLFGAILLVEIVLLCYRLLDRLSDFRFENVKDGLLTLATLATLVVTIMPIYVPQHIFGYTSIVFKPYGIYHLLWAVEIVVEIFVVTRIFYNKSYETKYIMLLVLTLSLILQYHQMFNMVGTINAQRFPLQLCNIGGALILLTLLTKNEKIYHFCVVSNVFGAILAIALLNVNNVGIGEVWNWHYIMEHQNVICVPTLMITLKMFKPLKAKDVKDVLICWAIYFFAVLVLGIWFNGIYLATDNTYWKCNYFFMFDVEKAVEFLPFTEKMFLAETGLFGSPYYRVKLIQLVIGLVFTGLFTGVFYVLYACESKRRKAEKDKLGTCFKQ